MLLFNIIVDGCKRSVENSTHYAPCVAPAAIVKASKQGSVIMPKASTRLAGKSLSITDLYKNFEAALAAADAVPDIPAGQSTEPFDRKVEKCSAIAYKIVQQPAQTVAEMLLKIRVAGWCADFPRSQLDHWQANDQDNAELHLIVSPRGDLHKLCRRGFLALTQRFDHVDL
jgi:hypothetical protein